MTNRPRIIIMTAALLIGAALWLPDLRSRRVAAQSAGLIGSYGFTLTQVYSGGNPPAALTGVATFDGSGNVMASFTIVQVDPDPKATTVQFQPIQNPGTYTVNANGTGTLTFPGGGGGGSISFVITDGGSGLMLLPTAGFGNSLFTGTARKQ